MRRGLPLSSCVYVVGNEMFIVADIIPYSDYSQTGMNIYMEYIH